MDMRLFCFILGGLLGAWGGCSHAKPPHPMPPPHHYSHHHNHSGDIVLGTVGIITGLAVLNAMHNQRQRETIVLREVPRYNQIVYWCESERGFYPDVRACPEGWRKVQVMEIQ